MLDPAAVAGVDAVINLAGTPSASRSAVRLPVGGGPRPTGGSSAPAASTPPRRWRRAIAAADPRPRCSSSASAVGWYGDTGDTEVDEQAPAGDGFLADVCRVWEAATGPAEAAGVRVVRLRTGFPLHRTAACSRRSCPCSGSASPGGWAAAGSGAVDLDGRLAGRGHPACWAATTSPDPVNLVGSATGDQRASSPALGRELHRPAVIAGARGGAAAPARRVRPRLTGQRAGDARGADPRRVPVRHT